MFACWNSFWSLAIFSCNVLILHINMLWLLFIWKFSYFQSEIKDELIQEGKSRITNQKYFLFEHFPKYRAFHLSHTIRFIIPFWYCQLYLSRSNTAVEAKKVYFIHSTLLWILLLQHWNVILRVGGCGMRSTKKRNKRRWNCFQIKFINYSKKNSTIIWNNKERKILKL